MNQNTLILVVSVMVLLFNSAVIASNLAFNKPYAVSVAPYDGYLDILGPEPYTEVGKYYRGELTDANMGSNLRDYVGWRYIQDTLKLVIDVDLEGEFRIAQIQQTIHKATPELVYWRVYTTHNNTDWELWVTEPRITEYSQAMYKLYHYENTYRRTATRVRIEMGIDRIMYIYSAEIIILDDYASPISIDNTSWQILKLLRLE
jgi:hypothetical protein